MLAQNVYRLRRAVQKGQTPNKDRGSPSHPKVYLKAENGALLSFPSSSAMHYSTLNGSSIRSTQGIARCLSWVLTKRLTSQVSRECSWPLLTPKPWPSNTSIKLATASTLLDAARFTTIRSTKLLQELSSFTNKKVENRDRCA